MCRMIGIVRKKTDNFNLLNDFKRLADQGRVIRGAEEGHDSGWGLFGYVERMPCLFGKSPESVAKEAEDFEQAVSLIDEAESPVIVGHLRKATAGDISFENTHPFQEGKWVFCHNGTLFEAEEKIPLAEGSEVEGNTDTERFFKFLLGKIAGFDPETVLKALSQAILHVQRSLNYTALNFLLSNGDRIYAYRDFNENYKGSDHTLDDLNEYYTLFYAQQETSVAVCSEPVGEAGLEWQPLSNKELLVADRLLKVQRYSFSQDGEWLQK